MKKLLLFSFVVFGLGTVFAQNSSYWQQHVDYKMDVTLDVKTYQYTGKQELVYTNNSSDTLRKVYYHLFNNAFQPGSEMDARIQSIKDPDGRMVTKIKVDGKEVKESRIKNLKPNEIGFLRISNFKQDGAVATAKEVGTILEVTLAKPILPNTKTTFTLDFEGQVPIQIRRSGRNNAEGVALSMSQWYPKMAEFDFEGWHADPYIAREFHGVWGNFDVNITIDKDYVLGGTGYLQNKNEIGHGYQDQGVVVSVPKKTKMLTWHFNAPMVHDFTWAADPDYIHDVVKGPNGVDLHFLYKNNPKYIQNWKNLQPKTVQLMEIYNKTVGDYPYKQYSVIQGGDGGMEYAMCTLILGQGSFEGLLGVTAHEMAHSWFQHVLASNESKHGWMDEGFTSFLEDFGLNEIANKKVENPYTGAYTGYFSMANSGKELPQGTHADRFDENRVYSITSYSKGEIFLTQLMYLIGKDNVMKTLKKYYSDFKFKHPTPNDIKRSAERISGANLDWYLVDWTETTNTIDYGIKDIKENGDKTTVTLERIGRMPMPIDLLVEYTDGTTESFYIPLRMMSFEKENPNPAIKRTVLNDWAWAYPTFEFDISKSKTSIKKITIDPSGLMADLKKENNTYEIK
ncbi:MULTISPECIES: M1 family metallopeptidase [unclassified Flavobacterium]|uniref:M1 family metallopeptidase n=1 Tax=unclassified Flavobacterium TaxID=196869 RepID=UPI000F826726|nr:MULTISPECIES: M1 family metallopeptidase [unclassified Flavobacterium]RTY96285.1 M1 family peptidase [Flavobacterium sp. GSN2]RTY76414.1 M1 family peptidase [Flavobacterium sp. LS1R10]RTY88215.1 M1 family peptidase [Flavobacterium sp. RSP15]RTY92710.1 M1 family peptidase [Flavobacterium sp. RSP46]RTZ09086.1 M1 family peptidase [Flavobacterium sp. GSP6]